MSININGTIRARLKHIIDLIDYEEGTPCTYIFIKCTSEQGYQLAHNEDTLIDDRNYIFNTKEEINNFLIEQARLKGVKKITPILINVVDNSHLEKAMYIWQ